MCENGERYVVCMTQRVKFLFARAFFYRDVLEKYLDLQGPPSGFDTK